MTDGERELQRADRAARVDRDRQRADADRRQRRPGDVWWQMVDAHRSPIRTRSARCSTKRPRSMLTGLAVSIALDAGLFNIGGEAQLGAGVLACARRRHGAARRRRPRSIAIPLCMLAAAAGRRCDRLR